MNSNFESPLKRKNAAYIKSSINQEDKKSKRIAFVLFEHFSMMAFTGAVDALVTANLMKPSTTYEVIVVGNNNTVISDLGIEISVDIQLSMLDEKSLDAMLLCGGYRVKLQPYPLLRKKVKAASSAGVTLGGLWNGAYFLAEAGLLDGYECAYHPDGRVMMTEEFPSVIISNQNYVEDRNRISCAGASSSLDMMLMMIKNELGDELVNSIEEILSCDKKRETLDISTANIDYDPTLPQPLKTSLELMQKNIEEPLSIEEIASYSNISRRQLERLFTTHIKASPSRYYLELRLTYARQLLQLTNKPITDIAVATGFNNIPHFRRCFYQLFNISASQFRKTYRGSMNT